MNIDTLKQLVKQHVTASASKQHHMIQPVQLALRTPWGRSVEEAFRHTSQWLELLADYEPTTRRSYLTGMRDILRVAQLADALQLDAAERATIEERLGVLIKEAGASTNDPEKAALRLRVQLLEHALDIIAGVIRSSTGSA